MIQIKLSSKTIILNVRKLSRLADLVLRTPRFAFIKN